MVKKPITKIPFLCCCSSKSKGVNDFSLRTKKSLCLVEMCRGVEQCNETQLFLYSIANNTIIENGFRQSRTMLFLAGAFPIYFEFPGIHAELKWKGPTTC